MMGPMLTALAPPASVNGLPVLASKPLPDRDGCSPGHIVMCLREDDVPDRWVTWIAYTHDHGTVWWCTEGHYFTDEGEARADLLHRTG